VGERTPGGLAVNPSYRLGAQIVLGTLLAAALLSPILNGLRPSDARAGHNLVEKPPLGSFRFTERSGRSISQADLADRVWIAAFIFTRCPSSCPRISQVMHGLQERLRGTGVRLVSFTVDPEHDSPPVLAEYARRLKADTNGWWFLTGPKLALYDFILSRFHLGVVGTSLEDQAAGAESISHSAKLVLIDRGNRMVGYFDSDEPADLRLLESRARQRDLSWPPAFHASLNGSSALLLLAGWFLIRSRRVRGHATCMALAVGVSVLFLASYIAYHYQVGSVAFRGSGLIRIAYFTILLSHTVLAVAAVPLVGTVLARAIRRSFEAHARLARVAFPVWLYVSITGVLVYLMLYQMDFPASAG
jgi:protein SCO1